MNQLQESGGAPSPFWASFFSPIKLGGGGGQGVGWLFSEGPADTSVLCPDLSQDPCPPHHGALSQGQPHSVTCHRVLRQVTPPPPCELPFHRPREVITSVFHSDARMSTCTCPHFLPPERGARRGGGSKGSHRGRAGKQMNKPGKRLSRRKKRIFLSQPRGSQNYLIHVAEFLKT